MTNYLTINPKEIPTAQLFGYLTGTVAPRPIAFASTVDKEGKVNLSPFSFFNVFGANPPTMVFSPSRRVRGNTTKDTLDNVLAVPEVVINIVNYSMVQQMSLSSTEYPKGVNEFVKAGFTEVVSEKVKPPRVGESPAAFECIVKEVIATGDGGGAGNLVICEVVLAHFKPEIFDETGQVDPFKLDAVARMGSNWYCRANGEMVFEVAKPLMTTGMGIDQLPDVIRNSHILTGNDLGQLGNVENLPSKESIAAFAVQNHELQLLRGKSLKKSEFFLQLHHLAHTYLEQGKVEEAWKILLQPIHFE
ncbi:MAG: flavin reductase family protein [Chitinophagales bacterium]